MKNIAAVLFSFVFLMALSLFGYAQEAKKPVRKDGDWWRVKVQGQAKGGGTLSSCTDLYSEYLIKISGNKEEAIQCPEIWGRALGGSGRLRRLEFPLSVGRTWTGQRKTGSRRRKLRTVDYKVLSWEKVQIPKGSFDAFKIQGKLSFRGGDGGERNFTWDYFYSPEAKAIISFNFEAPRYIRKFTVVDFKVSQ